ncbi:MAG: hypothetical protein BAJALOKI2v1_50053 [Promethearchaeota archaeon]|nr:MAG: hypothetical protein BAJALOKI2v1_50053 [Candidatus Lokiarchaeota archaeon]
MRKKFHLKDGDKVPLVEDQGRLRVIPIRSEKELRKNFSMSEEMKKMSRIIKKEEITREL